MTIRPLLSSGEEVHAYLRNKIAKIERELIELPSSDPKHRELYVDLEFLRLMDAIGVIRNG